MFGHSPYGSRTHGGLIAFVIATLLEVVASGGATTGGTAGVSFVSTPPASGGMTTGGGATVASTITRSETGSGGATTGGAGTVTPTILRSHTATGGATSGGAGTVASTITQSITGTGGATSGGTATVASTITRSLTGSGGATSGGAGTVASTITRSETGSGGATTGGAATVASTVLRSLTATGGATSGGTAPYCQVFPFTATGGATTGGTATVASTVLRSHTATGGATSGGTATVASTITLSITGSGGATSGGAATVKIVFYPEVGGLAVSGSGATISCTVLRTETATGGATTGGAAPCSITLSINGGNGPNLGTYGGGAFGSLAWAGGAFITTPADLGSKIQTGGAAIASTSRSYVGSGGLIAGGTTTPAITIGIEGQGGAALGGGAQYNRAYVFTPSGGLTTGGSANMAVVLNWTPSGGLVSGGRAWFGDTYKLTLELGGPGFMVGDIILAQRVDYDGQAAKLLVYRVVGEVIVLDGEGEVSVAITEGAEYLPGFGQGIEFVRIGNRFDTDRQGSLYLTADDNFAPYMDVIDGIDDYSKLNTMATIKVRLGRLDGIIDDEFGQLEGYGLYGQNVYLRGNMVLSADSVIQWASVTGTGKPADYATVGATWGSDLAGIPNDLAFLGDIPTLPGYITSTKITATTVEAPTISSNATLTGWIIASAGGGNTAGMTGAETGDDAVRIWAGDTYANALLGLAPFSVTQGGKTKISDGELTVANSDYSQKIVIDAPGGLARIAFYGIWADDNPVTINSFFEYLVLQTASGGAIILNDKAFNRNVFGIYDGEGRAFFASAAGAPFTVRSNSTMVDYLNANFLGGMAKGEFLWAAAGESATLPYKKGDGSTGNLTFVNGQLVGQN